MVVSKGLHSARQRDVEISGHTVQLLSRRATETKLILLPVIVGEGAFIPPLTKPTECQPYDTACVRCWDLQGYTKDFFTLHVKLCFHNSPSSAASPLDLFKTHTVLSSTN